MAAEPERGPSSSRTIPNPISARIGALIFLVLAVIALLFAAFGLLGLTSSILDGQFAPLLNDHLILALGGGSFAAFFLVFVREFLAMAKRDRRARQLAAGRCPRCGYDIRHLPAPRCPECGEAWTADEAGKHARILYK